MERASDTPEDGRGQEPADELVRPVRLRPADDALPRPWDGPPPAPAPTSGDATSGDATSGEAPLAGAAPDRTPSAPPASGDGGPPAPRAAARPRLTLHLRCAFCHDLLGAAAGHPCPGCGTRLHPECVDEEGRCPTLGCVGLAPRARRWRWPWDVRAADTRRPRSVSVGPSRTRRALRVAGGLLLPLVCFVANEVLTANDGRHPLAPEWQGQSGLGWVFDARVQRGLYPALVWALWAFWATTFAGRRGPWVRAGLEGGVAVAALFMVVYTPVVPVSLVAVVFLGLGLLGLGPFPAFASFLGALLRYRRAAPPDEAEPVAAPRLLFGLLTGGGLALGVRTALDLHAALPAHPNDCFVATAAARADARLTGAVLVRGPDGRARPVTRQLRTLKAFELLLVGASPRAHRALRAVYDRVGPPVARRLGPRGAALAWAALLPAQAAARLALGLALRDAADLIARTYPPRR